MTDEPLWRPSADARASTRLGRFIGTLEARHGVVFADHEAAWRWSVDHLDETWQAIADDLPVRWHDQPTAVLADRSMPGAKWFPGGTLNYAEHALIADDDAVAIIGRSQTRPEVVVTGAELRDQVARCAAGLRRLGIGRGDRVAAYLPNIPETIVAFLATASLGAVWTSCAPEFGTRSVVDRLSQIEPSLLLVVGGYRYGAKDVHRTVEVAAIRAALPSLDAVVEVAHLAGTEPVPDAVTWDDLLADHEPLAFEAVPFDHPLYVLYSSGTTGLPKPIVHGHGGITVEHAKALGLYCNLGPGDRFFWFSTTGWMMWNFLVSGLLVGATVVTFDGNPGHPTLDGLWAMAQELGVTFFGTSAPFLMACRKEGLQPGADHDLSAIRAVGSTGAPLPPEGFAWVYDAVKADVLLSSVSGGTDVCTAFVGGSPLTPVRAGAIGCRWLGIKVQAFNEDAQPVVGETGELVVTAPMPSMPVGLWGDADGSRYHDAYFDTFPGVWRHGDWLTLADDGSMVISGRSDATLNRGGVRMGTAEFYSVVESFEEVTDSVVVHLEDDEGGLGELLLFVSLADGIALDDLRRPIATALRERLSPRHVPDDLIAVAGIPRTLSGKKLEVPIKRILRGADPAQAVSRGALANPEALDAFVAIVAARASAPVAGHDVAVDQ